MSARARRRARRNERGAVAVIFAISAVMIFGLAAIGVDLGNAMNRKKLTQNNADLAALAGAAKLPASDATSQGAVRDEVANWLNTNSVASDGINSCKGSDAAVTASDLSDGSSANGEVTFPSSDKVRVVSPPAKVAFGLATAIGFNDTCVQSVATAAIRSGGTGWAPYYATDLCASGEQSLKDDSPGPSGPAQVPPLKYPDQTNTSVLADVNNPYPGQIAVAAAGDPDGPVIAIAGTNLDAATIDKVGFFRSDGSEPINATAVASPPQSATSISVSVPNAVASVQDVWWIRVHNATTGTWSTLDEARPLLVGTAVLSCDPDPHSGNFGSINIPWTSNKNINIATAIDKGLPPPMSFEEFPGPAPYPGPNECKTDVDGVVSELGDLRPKTNCVLSTPGLRAPPAYDGYVKSGGKLDVDTTQLCQGLGRQPRMTLSTGEKINDDVLSCFLRNTTLHVSDAINFTGGPSPFVPELWTSPRFVLVPVVPADPGGEKWMPIVRFVPGFITGETGSSSRSSSVMTVDNENGFQMENPHKVRGIRIVFFDFDALPQPPDGGPLTDYIGSGPKVITLVN